MTCMNALLITRQSRIVTVMNPSRAGTERLSDLLEDRLDDLANQGRSRHTLTSYRIGVASFIASHGNSVADLTKPKVRKWMSSLAGFEPNSKSTRLAAVRSFGTWLVTEKIITENPGTIKPPKIINEPVDPYEPDEMASSLIELHSLSRMPVTAWR